MPGLPLVPARTAPRPLAGSLRLVRGGALGSLSLLLATVAHVVGGGSLPSAGVLAVTAVLLGLAAAVLTARRCRFGLLLGVLTVQQGLLHTLFDVAAAARACTPHLVGATHVHAGHPAGPLATCAPGAGMAMASGLPGWSMTLAHLVATAATAWLLARGEAWLWRVVDRVATAAGLRAARPARARRAPVPAPAPALVVLRRQAWRPAAPRGPPVLPAV